MSDDETGIVAYDLEPPARMGNLEELAAFLFEMCPECKTPGPLRHFSAISGCKDCADNDPRPVFTPVRNIAPHAGKCHRTASGIMIHVKPDCRCPR